MNETRFGLWYDFRNPGPGAPAFETLYASVLDQIVQAEGMGFDSVWLTEHHFVEDGYTPSPFVLAAAIGARTKRLHIGTNLMVLPLHDPIRIAEDAATVAVLTDGRFDLGVSIGYRQLEFEAFGRNIKQRPSLMEEAVEVIRRAWTGKPIRFQGKRYEYGDIAVFPVPARLPRILIGGMTPPAIDRVARIGDGFLSTAGIGHDLYIDALRNNGKDPSTGAIVAGHWAIIAEDPEAEMQRLAPCILHQTNCYVRWGVFGPEAREFNRVEDAVREGFYELWDAELAVEKLSALLKECPQIEDLHFWAQFPGESVESGTRRMRYIAENVLPRLRQS